MQVKNTAYTSLVRHTLEYSSSVWDPSSTEDIETGEGSKASCLVHSNYHDRTPGCVTKMVSDLGWEPLQKRGQIDQMTTLYKIQRGLVETDTGDSVPTNGRCTRGQQRLYQPAATVTVYKTSLPQGPSSADFLRSFKLYKDVFTLKREGLFPSAGQKYILAILWKKTKKFIAVRI